MSAQVQETSADTHIQYIQDMAKALNEYTLVKTAATGYDKAKHSVGLLERTLNYIEGTAYSATNNIAIPAYKNYGFPVTDRLIRAYTRGAETTKTAVDTTKNVAVTTGTVGLGLAIVSAQMGMNATIFGANLLLDTAIVTKNVGGSALNSALDVEKAVEQRIYLVLESTQKYAQVPADKLAEHANSFLDIANAVFDRLIGLPTEYEDPNSTVGQRITRLTKRVIGGLSARAHTDVIDPASQKIRYIVDQLNQKLQLADLVRQRRDWAFEKYGRVTSSVSDLREKVESQANQLNIRPEKMLLDSIRRTSSKLNENMEKFRNKTSSLLNGGVISGQIESATSYIQHLVSTFAEANDIYQIKDEVLDEAQHRLTEVAQLVSSPFLRHSSVSVDSVTSSVDDVPILNGSGENSPVDNSPLSSDEDERDD